MEERRDGPRRRTLKGGKIVLKKSGSVLDCTVRNMSEIGASLHVANTVAVPDEFKLQIGGGTRSCVIIWRRLDRIGVRFQ